MQKRKVTVIQRKAKPHLLHEFNQKGQHRLILVGEEKNDVSPWYEGHEIGYFNGYFFAGYGQTPIGPGVFRRQDVEARQVPAAMIGSAFQAEALQSAKSAQGRVGNRI